MTDIGNAIEKYRRYCQSNNGSLLEEVNDNNDDIPELPRPPTNQPNMIPKQNTIHKQNNYTALSIPRRIHKVKEDKPPTDPKEDKQHTGIPVCSKEDEKDDEFDIMMKQHMRNQNVRPVTPNYHQNHNYGQNRMKNINNTANRSIFLR